MYPVFLQRNLFAPDFNICTLKKKGGAGVYQSSNLKLFLQSARERSLYNFEEIRDAKINVY